MCCAVMWWCGAGGGGGINWGDDSSDSKSDSKSESKADGKAQPTADGGSKSGGLSLIDADTRHAFITDLMEVCVCGGWMDSFGVCCAAFTHVLRVW